MRSVHLYLFGIVALALCVLEAAAEKIIIIPINTPTPTKTPFPTSTPQRDLNKDGFIDSKDLHEFIMGWHQSVAGQKVEIQIPNIQPSSRPLRMVRIPGGTFQMGPSPGERGAESQESGTHLVHIEYDFFLAETEVTQAQWEAITGRNIGDQRNLTDPNLDVYSIGKDIPIYYISGDDAQEFINGLNALGQGTFRFPSEAEWEYACRAGTTSRFYFGDSLGCEDMCQDCPFSLLLENDRSDYMWYCSTDGGGGFPRGPKAVAGLLPNAFGLYDMHGNVWEFCADSYHFGYGGAPTDGSAWDPGGSFQIYRGGYSFGHAAVCRSATRGGIPPADRHAYAGLRVAMDVAQ